MYSFVDVHKRYGLRIVALRKLSFDIRAGEFFVLYGPAGAGKSTVLNLIAGLAKPTTGDIRRAGQSITHLPPERRGAAMAFENYALYSHLSVADNLAFPLRAAGLGRSEIEDRVRRIANVLGIPHVLDRRPGFLSGGQRQRVALGRAIIRPADIYLLDEPIGHLDAKLRHRMRAELKALAVDMNATIVFTTTSSKEALALGDRVAILNGGRLEQLGTPAEVHMRPVNAFVAGFVGEPLINFLDFTDADDSGLTIGGNRIPLVGRMGERLAGIGRAGPLSVSDPVQISDLSRAYVMAAQAAGIAFTPDFNGPRQAGTGFFQLTVKNGRRVSAADAFLHPAMKSGRITVLTGCLVHRVIIANGRATGVEYSRAGRLHTAQAAREVVMCAGAIAMPKILMLSGVGPHFHLKERGIRTQADLDGVGQNLQDHTEVPVLAFCNGPHGYFGQDRGWNQIRNGLQYLMFRSGPVASNGVEACSFFDPDDLTAEAKIQQFCIPSVYLDKDTAAGTKARHGITLNSCVLRPGSRGSVRLASADPAQQPLVDPNYFEDPEDLRLSVGGLRHARRILQQGPLKQLIDREILPGPAGDSDAALSDHARRFVKTVYHPVGTARMGRADDPLAVLTTDLRVKGVEGLRVADASAMPTIISGNTNSTTLVLADRAVSFILHGKAA